MSIYATGYASKSKNDDDWRYFLRPDGVFVQYHEFDKNHQCGVIKAQSIKSVNENDRIVSWNLREHEGAKKLTFAHYCSTLPDIAFACGNTFTKTLLNVDKEQRNRLLCLRMQQLYQEYTRLLTYAPLMWGPHAVLWEESLYRAHISMTELIKAKETFSAYTNKKQVKVLENTPVMPFNLWHTEEKICILRFKYVLLSTKFKVFKTGIRYPDGMPILRVVPSYVTGYSESWDSEMKVLKKIREVAKSQPLPGILIPLSVDEDTRLKDRTILDKLNFFSKPRPQYVVPYLPTTLEELLTPSLSDDQKEWFIFHATQAAYVTHKFLGIAHRDLKLNNFVVGMGDNKSYPLLIDWNFATPLTKKLETKMPGTKGWYSPEIIKYVMSKKNDDESLLIDWAKSDAWSLGVVLQCISEGKLSILYESQCINFNYFLKELHSFNQLPIPQPHTTKWIIRSLLKEDPEERMTIIQAFELIKTIIDPEKLNPIPLPPSDANPPPLTPPSNPSNPNRCNPQ